MQSFVFENKNVHCPARLDAYLNTCLDASWLYLTLHYDAATMILVIMTSQADDTQAAATRLVLQDALDVYPDADIPDEPLRDTCMLRRGDTLTYDEQRRTAVRIPLGLPQDTLTVDKTVPRGVAWHPTTLQSITIDDAETKYIHVTNRGMTAIDTAITDLLWLDTLRIDTDTFAVINGNVRIDRAGTYLCFWKAGFTTREPDDLLTIPPNDIGFRCTLTAGNGFVPLIESSYVSADQVSAFVLAPLHVTAAPVTIKTTATADASAAIVTSDLARDELYVIKLSDDVAVHHATALDIMALSATWTIVPFDNVMIAGIFTAGEFDVTAVHAAFIAVTVAPTTAGRSGDEAIVTIKLQTSDDDTTWSDVASNSVTISGHARTIELSWTQMYEAGMTARIVAAVTDLTAGSPMIVSATTDSCVTWIRDAGAHWASLTAGMGTDVAESEWTNVILDSGVHLDSAFTIDTYTLQTADAGTYLIIFTATTVNTAVVRMMVDNGQGLVQVTRAAGTDTLTCASLVCLEYNAIVRFQATANEHATIMPLNLTAVKFERSPLPMPPVPTRNVVASFHQRVDDTSASITNLTLYVTKVSLVTPSTLPRGQYKVSWAFTWHGTRAGSMFDARLLLDGDAVMSLHKTVIVSFDTADHTDSVVVLLEPGAHMFEMQWRSSGSQCSMSIANAHVELMRVG